ncbi:MAG: STAS domain-containing protein [Candidatus Sulfotelmatobacter sp.]
MLEIQTKRLPPDIVVLEIKGRITIGRECKQLEWATDTLVREKNEKKIIFDLSGVTHIDSTGVGIIVMSAGQAKQAGGELRLAGANRHIETVLKVTSIDKLVSWNPTVADAAVGF